MGVATKWPHSLRLPVPSNAWRGRCSDAWLGGKSHEHAGTASHAWQEAPPQNPLKIEYTYLLFAALHPARSRFKSGAATCPDDRPDNLIPTGEVIRAPLEAGKI